MFCPNCGSEVTNGEFCTKCGASLHNPTTTRFCAKCGAPLEYGSKICSKCGAEAESMYNQTDANVRSRGIDMQTPMAKQKSNKGLIAGIIAAVVVLALAAVFVLPKVIPGFPDVVSMITGGGANDSASKFAEAPEENVYHAGDPIKIMTTSYTEAPADDDNSVVKALENYVNEDLEFKWVGSERYESTVAGIIGSGDYPHVLFMMNAIPAFVQAARNDMFWDISEVFENPEKYPNLSKANPDVNHNISVDGKIYGIYRAREIGRAGVSIRKDWLDKLGLGIPTTIAEFSEVLRAFTEDDPDGNGLNDTYGMTVTGADYLHGPLDNIAVWMGAPNGWGIDEETGGLKPSFMFDEYTKTLKLMRDWYSEGYINLDIDTLNSTYWNDDFLNGRAGVIVDVADRARRLALNIVEFNPDAVVDVFGYVTAEAGAEPRTLPTNGYNGFYVFPKSTIKTHEDLERILTMMDKLNDLEAVNLMNYGIEGEHYTAVTVDGNKYAEKTTDKKLLEEVNDLNQISMGIVEYEDSFKTMYGSATADVAQKVEDVYVDNRQYAVNNIAAPYLSEAYIKNGPVLEDIINAAKLNFIIGKITEKEYERAIDKWLSEGGEDYIRDINEEYRKDTSVR